MKNSAQLIAGSMDSRGVVIESKQFEKGVSMLRAEYRGIEDSYPVVEYLRQYGMDFDLAYDIVNKHLE